jgi:hypothetical protein
VLFWGMGNFLRAAALCAAGGVMTACTLTGIISARDVAAALYTVELLVTPDSEAGRVSLSNGAFAYGDDEIRVDVIEDDMRPVSEFRVIDTASGARITAYRDPGSRSYRFKMQGSNVRVEAAFETEKNPDARLRSIVFSSPDASAYPLVYDGAALFSSSPLEPRLPWTRENPAPIRITIERADPRAQALIADRTLLFQNDSVSVPLDAGETRLLELVSSLEIDGLRDERRYLLRLKRKETVPRASGGDEVKVFWDTVRRRYEEAHIFRSSGALDFTPGMALPKDGELLIAAGGGGGGGAKEEDGGSPGGGGGAGGLLFQSGVPFTQPRYRVITGAGGKGGEAAAAGADGEDSVFGGRVARGGGGGAGHAALMPGKSGGSGGGGAHAGSGGAALASAFSGAFGNPGGTSRGDFQGSGGGGAGAAGEGALFGRRGAPGGDGRRFVISGAEEWYAGGGAAGRGQDDGALSLRGGKGGGGESGADAAGHSGGGGGGGNYDGARRGGDGAPGIVIIRFPYDSFD